MSRYIGIDLHKAKSFVTRMDERGQILEQVNLAHATGALQQYVTTLSPRRPPGRRGDRQLDVAL